jgi:hypothetical protein
MNGSIGPPVPSGAHVTYGAQLSDDHKRYHYQIGRCAFTCVSIPDCMGNCPEKRRIYHELYYAAGQIFNGQYASMYCCEDIKKKVYDYTYLLNKYNPHMIKYMGKITIKLYDYFEFQTGDQLNILTRDHRYISVNTLDPVALFELDAGLIYDINHFIPQELIKRRVAQAVCRPVVAVGTPATPSSGTPPDLPTVASICPPNATRRAHRLNAPRYIAWRRRKHIPGV